MAASSHLFAFPSRLHTASPFLCNILLISQFIFDIVDTILFLILILLSTRVSFSRTKPESSSYRCEIMPGQSELRFERFRFFVGDYQRNPG
ncbi:unnamed protein product [Thlaspi arvense]|uniref:Uncharacterized protein n=1 Tax=Thlaspi arvense TaxID=13288 RepID=A0AAU9SBX1_THLAR|nr:unnamed protein product [Thlaspi arvense]